MNNLNNLNNAATVQSMYEAFGRGDIPFIIDQLADDVRWEDGARDHGIAWLMPGSGKAHVMSFFGALSDLEFTTFDVQAVLGEGDLVVGVLQAAAKVLSTGGSFDNLEIHVWRFNSDGKVASFNHVLDTIQHHEASRATAKTI
jgi:uncharacterized protein